MDGVTDSETCPLSLVADDVVSSGPGDVQKKKQKKRKAMTTQSCEPVWPSGKAL